MQLRFKSVRSALVFGVAVPVLLSAAGAKAEPTVVGGVDKLQAEAVATQGTTPRDLDSSSRLFFKDKLRTGPGARLEAKLDDGTVLTLGEKGKMTIDEFTYNPAGKSTLALSVQQGAFLFVGGNIEGPTGGNVSIKTPVGTLGVRGTTVWGGHIDDGFGVLVLDGEVSVTTKKGSVILHKGEGTMVRGDAIPAAAAPWPEDRTKRAVATVSFN